MHETLFLAELNKYRLQDTKGSMDWSAETQSLCELVGQLCLYHLEHIYYVCLITYILGTDRPRPSSWEARGVVYAQVSSRLLQVMFTGSALLF